MRVAAMYGVELGMSHNNSVAGNTLSGDWQAGIIAQGVRTSHSKRAMPEPPPLSA